MVDAEDTLLINIFLRQQLQQFYDLNVSGMVPDLSNLNQGLAFLLESSVMKTNYSSKNFHP